MSTPSPHRPKRLEVTTMFEPHRLQDHLLQTAYAALVPLPRRRLVAASPSPVASPVQPLQDGERSAS